MKAAKKLVLVMLLTGLFIGCEDFGSVNVDPNNPSQVRTELLLTNAQRSMSDKVGAVMGTIWVQYITETQYTEAQEYRSVNADFNGWYTGPLQDLQTIIDLNSNAETAADVLSGGSNANQIAVARILKAYFLQMITDRWGMVPYSEALKGRENLQPAYDLQEDIYTDIITQLKEAADQIDLGSAAVNGDILFEGDMQKWIEFANSLRARAALRLSETTGASLTLAENEFADAISDGVITEDVLYPYLASADNENPWYTRFRTRTDYAISETMADYMKGISDSRILVFANPAPNYSDNDGVVEFNEIIGMPFAENAGDTPNAEISFPGAAIGAGGPGVGIQDAGLPIITVAEMELAQAEAVERGWIAGVAEDHYYAGIEASWNQWGVYEATDFANYIAQAGVAYDTNNWEELVGSQKWIALFPNGYEAWSEWRRTGFPVLTPNPWGVLNQIPLRFTYPSSEVSNNTENYNAAVSTQGPDEPLTPVWWDQ
ncbi:MAG: SusD/RagB family nutrient-binding outer membrane lipoprotein [Gracilimonas sp.]|uniref:SusD/RagB family nutrient-binding outer membrane lipoprotein n=1 Tax=Gracilimonas sp. TaxID=1974203 RepID=UPI0019909D84|nr:SusD/RagB family nutrient-binding outer membrane lipoprotein [Gracilimonas sp.]MBD3616380.1 SusD/RagB family nutrient-binding outer membrane lipoprotein [Gracilimonas sp.]